MRLDYEGTAYFAPSGLDRSDSTGTQGVAPGYTMAPSQGLDPLSVFPAHFAQKFFQDAAIE